MKINSSIEVTTKLGPPDEKTIPVTKTRSGNLTLAHVFSDIPGLARVEYFIQEQLGFNGGVYADAQGRIAIAEHELQNGQSFHESSLDARLRVRQQLAAIKPSLSNMAIIQELEQAQVWDEIIMLFPNRAAVGRFLTEQSLAYYGMCIPLESARTLIDLVSKVKV